MPASRLPTAGAPATWASSIPERRPRIASGVTCNRIVERRTALTKSAAPATASITSASGTAAREAECRFAIAPTRAPRRRRRGPAGAPASSSRRPPTRRARPPTERRRAGLVVSAPPPSSSANAGNSALGMPKIIAIVSTVKIPSSACSRRTSRNPSAIARGSASRRPRSGRVAAAARSRRARTRRSRGRRGRRRRSRSSRSGARPARDRQRARG